MSVLKDLNIRPSKSKDAEILDQFRAAFQEDGRIDVPFGYSAVGVETAVAEKQNKIIGAAIATKTVLIDFTKDPAASPAEIAGAVFCLERALTYVAQQNGCVAAYVAIPSHMTEWLKVVKHGGYTETFQHCTVLRRPLAKELTPEK